MRTRLTQPFMVFDGDGGSGSGGTDAERAANRLAEAQRKQAEAEAQRKAEKQRADDLEARLSSLEGANDSELQKAIKRAEKAERERDDFKGKLSTNEREKHVRSVAGSYNPHDVEALFRFVDLDTINSEDDAKRALDGLKDTSSFLFKTEENNPENPPTPTPGRPQGFGSPVPAGGAPVPPAVPVGPDGQPDVQQGIGMGLLGAIDRFRSTRGQ